MHVEVLIYMIHWKKKSLNNVLRRNKVIDKIKKYMKLLKYFLLQGKEDLEIDAPQKTNIADDHPNNCKASYIMGCLKLEDDEHSLHPMENQQKLVYILLVQPQPSHLFCTPQPFYLKS